MHDAKSMLNAVDSSWLSRSVLGQSSLVGMNPDGNGV